MIFGFFIEICATLIEYLGALIFVDYKIYRPNLRRIVYFIFPITLFTVIVNSIEVVSINSIAAYFIYMGGFVFIVYRKEWLEKVLLVIVYFLLILICDYVGVAFFGVILQDNDYILHIMQIGSLTRVAFIFLAKSLLILTSIGVRVFIQKYVPLEKYKYLIALGILGSIFVYITYKFSSVYALIGWIIYLVFAGMLMGIFYFHSRWEKAENDRRILYLKTNSYIEYYENLLKV